MGSWLTDFESAAKSSTLPASNTRQPNTRIAADADEGDVDVRDDFFDADNLSDFSDRASDVADEFEKLSAFESGSDDGVPMGAK